MTIETQHNQSSVDCDAFELLGLLYSIACYLENKTTPRENWSDVLPLVKQFFDNTMTIYFLKDGIKFKFPRKEYSELMLVFVPGAILARATLEIYCNLHQVFFDTTNEEDLFHFEYYSWKLSGYIHNSWHVVKENRTVKGFQDGIDYIENIKSQIQKTNKFKNLTKRQQDRILQGHRKSKRNEIIKQIGIKGESEEFLYHYLSSFTHSDGFSVDQVSRSYLREDTKLQIQVQFLFLNALIAHLIIDLYDCLPDARIVCDENQLAYDLALYYVQINKQGTSL